MIGNALGGQHTYVQYVSLPEGGVGPPYIWGWGFGAPGTGSEAHFNPNHCKPCTKGGATLQYGSASGKSGSDATDAEIQDCIKNAKPSKPYHRLKYNCKDWAKEAAKKCGLDCK